MSEETASACIFWNSTIYIFLVLVIATLCLDVWGCFVESTQGSLPLCVVGIDSYGCIFLHSANSLQSISIGSWCRSTLLPVFCSTSWGVLGEWYSRSSLAWLVSVTNSYWLTSILCIHSHPQWLLNKPLNLQNMFLWKLKQHKNTFLEVFLLTLSPNCV